MRQEIGVMPSESALATCLAARIPRPIDSLELAAVIESLGIDDDRARRAYGAADVFELAARVYPDVLRSAARSETRGARDDLDEAEALPGGAGCPFVSAPVRTLAAIPLSGHLLILLNVLSQAGWSTGSGLVLCLGETLGILAASCLALVTVRRSAVDLGREQDDTRRDASLAFDLTLALCGALVAISLGVTWVFGLGTPVEHLALALSACATGLVWVISSAPTLPGRAWRVSGSFLGSLAVGVTLAITGGPFLGIAVGYITWIVVLAVEWYRVFMSDGESRQTLKRFAEGPPYLLYGTVLATLVVAPYVLGRLGHGSPASLHDLGRFELSFLLALLPVLLAFGLNEIALDCFSADARRRENRRDYTSFNAALERLYRHQMRKYLLVLATMTVVVVAVVELVVLSRGLHGLTQSVFLEAVLAMSFVGVGQFNALFLLAVSNAESAIVTALGGLVTVCAVGLPLTLIDYRLAALGAVAGAGAFAAGSMLACRTLFHRVDHRYVHAL